MSNVDRPDHYGGDDCIRQMEMMNIGISYCMSTAYKYLYRCGDKVPSGKTHKETLIEDLEKCLWCCNRALDNYQLTQENNRFMVFLKNKAESWLDNARNNVPINKLNLFQECSWFVFQGNKVRYSYQDEDTDRVS